MGSPYDKCEQRISVGRASSPIVWAARPLRRAWISCSYPGRSSLGVVSPCFRAIMECGRAFLRGRIPGRAGASYLPILVFQCRVSQQWQQSLGLGICFRAQKERLRLVSCRGGFLQVILGQAMLAQPGARALVLATLWGSAALRRERSLDVSLRCIQFRQRCQRSTCVIKQACASAAQGVAGNYDACTASLTDDRPARPVRVDAAVHQSKGSIHLVGLRPLGIIVNVLRNSRIALRALSERRR